MEIEIGPGGADLADQHIRGTKRRVIALAPEQPDPTADRSPLTLRHEVCEVVEERPAAADLATVEPRVPHAVRLDVDRLLGDARRIAEHVDQQVVAADLAEQRIVVAGLSVASRRSLGIAAWRESRRRDQAEMRD